MITEEGALEAGTVADDCVSAWCSAHCCQPAHGGRQDAELQSAGGAGRGQPRSWDRGCLSPAILRASGRWQQEAFCGTRLSGWRTLARLRVMGSRTQKSNLPDGGVHPRVGAVSRVRPCATSRTPRSLCPPRWSLRQSDRLQDTIAMGVKGHEHW